MMWKEVTSLLSALSTSFFTFSFPSHAFSNPLTVKSWEMEISGTAVTNEERMGKGIISSTSGCCHHHTFPYHHITSLSPLYLGCD